MLQLHTITIPANSTVPMPFDADYIRIKAASAEFRFKTDAGDDFVLSEGEEAKIERFQVIRITNRGGSAETLSLYIGNQGAEVGSAKVSGSLSLSGASLSQGRESVSNVNVQLLAGNSSRRYLLIQNNDTACVLRVTVDGAVATAGEGFRLQPGESIEFPTVAPSSAINAIMETASAVVDNVEFVEG